MSSANARRGPGSTTVRAPWVSSATRLPPEVTSVRAGVPGSTVVVSETSSATGAK
ncbi:hypothetical protein ABT269_08060 [Streptomyces viridosporus]|uniref:hypothetical protein n=1 Tax=Streptomyces viridosporus TaxID=67581 RepID=UPI00332BB446